MEPFIILISILILLAVAIPPLFFYRTKQARNLGASLGLALYLVSIPESPKANENPVEALKNFIGEMEKFLIGISSALPKDTWVKSALALEIAAHNDGREIFFYVAFPRAQSKLLSSQLAGAFPEARIEQVADYNIFHPEGPYSGAFLALRESNLLPIKTYNNVASDPVETITGAFSKLKEHGEGAALQLILRPAPDSLKSRARHAVENLKKGKSRKEVLATGEAKKLAKEMLGIDQKKKKSEEISAQPMHDENLVGMIEDKASKFVFNCNIRILASSGSAPETKRILQELKSSFAQFDSPSGNGFLAREVSGARLSALVEMFSFRLFDDGSAIKLNVEEISSIFHFPYSKKAAPQVRMLKSREASPPINLPKEGILIGKSAFRGEEQEVRIKKDDRRRHFYTIGQTGTGKSVLLQNMIVQDIRNGEGVAVIDPHGELIEKVLELIPKERADDVIYFDPGDTAYPMGLNMLEYDPRFPEHKTLIVNELLDIFNKLFNMSVAGGPMFEQYFRNAALLVMEDPESGNTLLEIEKLLADKSFRDYKLSRSKNIIVDTFWRQIAEKAGGEASLQNMVPYVVSKFDTFLANDIMRPIIAQEKSSFNVREAMDNKKILLLNLSKGRLGELNSSLLGLIMVGKILMAALSRVNMPEADRQDFYLYIDEFQNVTTKSIATILSEARKYKLDLILTHQFIGQLEEDIQKAVFGNVGSICAFRIGSDDAEYMAGQFAPTFTAPDLLNIDNRNAYLKLLVDGQTSKPFNIKPLAPEKGDPQMAEYIKQLSRSKFARPRDEVEEEIRKRHKGGV